MAAMEVTCLFVYPVKSCGGIRVQSWEVGSDGALVYDHKWAVVTDDGEALTQRRIPKMSLVSTSLDIASSPRTITVSAPGVAPFTAALTDDPDGVPAEDSAALSRWFSSFLATQCTWRSAKTAGTKASGNGRNFLGSANFLFVSQSSLDDLLARVPEEHRPAVDSGNFRPSVIVGGAPAYDEDGWGTVTIGQRDKAAGMVFKGVKLCKCCALHAVDKRTGTLGKEPLATMAKYRKSPSSGELLFGVLMNMVQAREDHKNNLVISVGMPVTVSERVNLFH